MSATRVLAAGITAKLGLAWLALAWLRGLSGIGAHPGPLRPPADDPRPARVVLVLVPLLLAMAYAAVLAAVQARRLRGRRPEGWVSHSATAAGLAAALGLLVVVVLVPRIDGGAARFLVLELAVYASVLGEGLAMHAVQRALLRAG